MVTLACRAVAISKRAVVSLDIDLGSLDAAIVARQSWAQGLGLRQPPRQDARSHRDGNERASVKILALPPAGPGFGLPERHMDRPMWRQSGPHVNHIASSHHRFGNYSGARHPASGTGALDADCLLNAMEQMQAGNITQAAGNILKSSVGMESASSRLFSTFAGTLSNF